MLSLNNVDYSPKVHYHIHWSSTEILDWQPFQTRGQADAIARSIVKKDEGYKVEEFSEICRRCKDFLSQGR